MRILLIITGSIAAYKIPELIRLLKQKNMEITCVITKSAKEFVGELTLASLSHNKVYSELFSLTDELEMGHIRLARDNDIMLIAPASADFIAKLAHGNADDLASTIALASKSRMIIAPAMNVAMWENKATQDNIAILQSRGVEMIHPTEGELACGEYGAGKLAAIEDIVDYIASSQKLHGKKAVITAGATIEPIDPVRFISNHSSGKQAAHIAESLATQGVKVKYIAGRTEILPIHHNITIHQVKTAQDMYEATLTSLPADIAICAAAVSDFRLLKVSDRKIKKGEKFVLGEFIENEDILKTIANHKARPKFVIGFALETENIEENAKIKLYKKNCDAILANSQENFGTDEANFTWIDKNMAEKWVKSSKKEIAERITQKIIDFFT